MLSVIQAWQHGDSVIECQLVTVRFFSGSFSKLF